MRAVEVIRDAWRWLKGEPTQTPTVDDAEPVREWLAREERASRDYLERLLVYRREHGG